MYADHKSAAKSMNPMKFVKKHKTAIACTVTAATVAIVTRKLDTLDSDHQISMLYATGRETGVLLTQNTYLRAFIETKGLTEEVSAFIKDIEEF